MEHLPQSEGTWLPVFHETPQAAFAGDAERRNNSVITGNSIKQSCGFGYFSSADTRELNSRLNVLL